MNPLTEETRTEFMLALGGLAWDIRTKVRMLEVVLAMDGHLTVTTKRLIEALLKDLGSFEPEIAKWLTTPEGQRRLQAAAPGLGA